MMSQKFRITVYGGDPGDTWHWTLTHPGLWYGAESKGVYLSRGGAIRAAQAFAKVIAASGEPEVVVEE